jgi:hypothetical protein
LEKKQLDFMLIEETPLNRTERNEFSSGGKAKRNRYKR